MEMCLTQNLCNSEWYVRRRQHRKWFRFQKISLKTPRTSCNSAKDRVSRQHSATTVEVTWPTLPYFPFLNTAPSFWILSSCCSGVCCGFKPCSFICTARSNR